MYLRPPDIITYDVNINFNNTKFRNKTRFINVTYHQVPIKAH